MMILLDVDLYIVVKLSYTGCYITLKRFITYYGGVGYEYKKGVFCIFKYNNGI